MYIIRSIVCTLQTHRWVERYSSFKLHLRTQLQDHPWAALCCSMGAPNLGTRSVLHFMLCCAELVYVGSADHTTPGDLVMHQYPRPLNFVWTNSLTEGQFGTFRFGIGLSKDAKAGSKKARETITHFVQVGVNEQLYVTVTAETNLSNAMLITTSCQLVSGQNSSRTYLIREGCLDNWIAKEVRREDMEVVFSPHLFRLPLVPGSFMVLITCELKLCLTTNQSQPCGSNCALTPPHHQPIRSLLETGTHHVTSRPIHIVRELRETATNYAALVIGLVLGGTVVAVVVLLVRKSFGGVRRRNASLDL